MIAHNEGGGAGGRRHRSRPDPVVRWVSENGAVTVVKSAAFIAPVYNLLEGMPPGVSYLSLGYLSASLVITNSGVNLLRCTAYVVFQLNSSINGIGVLGTGTRLLSKSEGSAAVDRPPGRRESCFDREPSRSWVPACSTRTARCSCT